MDTKSGSHNKKYTCGVFVDFQKAFDTVNHDILLKKLSHYGIRGSLIGFDPIFQIENNLYLFLVLIKTHLSLNMEFIRALSWAGFSF